MATPAMLGLVFFVATPFALAVIFSFTNLHLGSPLPVQWVGTLQYERLIRDPGFLRALSNNIVFALLVVPMQTGLALVIALLLHQRLRGLVFFRTLFFLPVVFPLSLIAIVWMMLLAPGESGSFNGFLQFITLDHWQAKDFLRDPGWALAAIVFTSVWQGLGFQMIILLAALQAIDEQLYEAAHMDGAGAIQRFWYITLPQLRNALIFVVLATAILAFRLFDQVQIMTQGGPQQATTTVMYEAVRAAFSRQQIAKGAAMSVLLFTIVLTITLISKRAMRYRKW